MDEQSLYDLGWRQGSLVVGPFVATCLDVDADGSVQANSLQFRLGVICTQDCDLSSSASTAGDPPIEVRPVRVGGAPNDWGIRSRTLRLSDEEHVSAEDPRAFVSPRFLVDHCTHRRVVEDGRAVALKTWLGLRFDRPAVPEHLVDAAREVARRFGTRSGRVAADQVHDVLMQFDDSKTPPHVALFAVVTDDADESAIRKWLAETATRVRTEVAVVAHIAAGTKEQTSLALIESSYAANLSQVTWGGSEPSGAT